MPSLRTPFLSFEECYVEWEAEALNGDRQFSTDLSFEYKWEVLVNVQVVLRVLFDISGLGFAGGGWNMVVLDVMD